jgi:hypothetical protein
MTTITAIIPPENRNFFSFLILKMPDASIARQMPIFTGMAANAMKISNE